ncbi:MAG: MBOAT family protein, partial [Eubacterium sp.]|nr:MBOAT family protein [Eubacterium sp.]
MVFSSATFLFLFLPITVAAYYIIGGLIADSYRLKNAILLLASLVFYAWGEPVYIVLMLLSIVFNFVAGKNIALSKRAGRDKRAKLTFVVSLVFNIGVLGFFKYADFAIENIRMLFGLHLKPLNLPLPIGISFYTFQVMSYIIDLYNGKIRAQRKLLDFALYISLFPQLIAGPIVKYKDIQLQLKKRDVSANKFGRGLSRFLVGMAKKLMLANTLGAVFSTVQEFDTAELGALSAWVGIFCYTLQIYFDFSGYSDMAIGLGKMFGFEFNENFNYPYVAISATDFWRRWHISLSSWFRDYVYIPLGGNRRKTPRVIFNLLVVWLLTGLWHGAAWNFVLWGLYYGVVLILEKYLLSKPLERLPKP